MSAGHEGRDPADAPSELTVEYLVGLAMEAINKPARRGATAEGAPFVFVGSIENDLRERMAQAVTVHRLELDLAREESRS